ncbi:hypothetical protein PR048_028605 [Dryococelus australis]|uniref:G-protein coupled receptors family 1 profile domain-containing protein n=1 Tax=Dryococelus australis TaxID=614101 RepID=A0ABQ9GBH5_9NEOP|nr:hypothetical protein PR048_028605 [Dryococelus australis]
MRSWLAAGGEKLIIWLANSRDEEYYSCEEQADLDRVLYCNVTHNTWPFYYSSTCMRQFLTRRRTEASILYPVPVFMLLPLSLFMPHPPLAFMLHTLPVFMVHLLSAFKMHSPQAYMLNHPSAFLLYPLPALILHPLPAFILQTLPVFMLQLPPAFMLHLLPVFKVNPSTCHQVLAYRVVSAMLTCVFAILLLVGVLGNLSLIYMCVAIAELRTSANMYVVSLAVSDVFLTTLYTPFIASLYSDYVTLWGPAYRLGKVVEEVAILASAWTLVAMSLERYLSLRHVGPPRPATTPLRRALKILAIWLAAGAMAAPSVVRALMHSQRCYTYYAAPDDGFDALVEAWDLLVSYALPLALIAACYCSSARLLFRSAAAIPGEQQAQQVARRRSSARMVLSLVLLFLAFYSPQYLVNLYGLVHLAASGQALQDSSIAFGVLVDVVQFVRVVHSCLTPVLLYCTVARFRKYLRRGAHRLAVTARALLH